MISKNESGLYETEVDGKKYEFEKWGADESLDVLMDLTAMMGPALGGAVHSVMSGDGLDTDINAGMIGSIMESMTKNLKKDIVKALIKKLCADKVLCDGKKIVFNVHYADDLFHMFKVVKAGLEVQYANFFSAARGAVAPGRPIAVMNRAL